MKICVRAVWRPETTSSTKGELADSASSFPNREFPERAQFGDAGLDPAALCRSQEQRLSNADVAKAVFS